jgi:pimeloyl-ACP methyl ester carboxylesterase
VLETPPPLTAQHRGGTGPPLVLLHGFLDTWRTWELVLPALERHHEVLAPTLPGHAGGPALGGEPSTAVLADAVEALMDAAGLTTAHLAGNSLGGFLALVLATRGRAASVVAFSPAGGWPAGSRPDALFAEQWALQAQARALAPQVDALLATPQGRRRLTERLTVRFEHLPDALLAAQLLGVARADGAAAMLEAAGRDPWTLDAAALSCPVRIVWGTEDRLLPWPRAAERFRRDWLPHADWVVLDDVGHAPQLDVPLEAAQLVLGWTSG